MVPTRYIRRICERPQIKAEAERVDVIAIVSFVIPCARVGATKYVSPSKDMVLQLAGPALFRLIQSDFPLPPSLPPQNTHNPPVRRHATRGKVRRRKEKRDSMSARGVTGEEVKDLWRFPVFPVNSRPAHPLKPAGLNFSRKQIHTLTHTLCLTRMSRSF